MKTKGALVWDLNQPWTIDEIEIGDPRRGEVTVQLETAGLCHSDHHLLTGDFPIPSFPVLGGHEGAGVITEVGDGVENLAVGDRVVMSFIPSCGKCIPCQVGLRNLCDLGMGLLSGASVSDGSFRVTARGATSCRCRCWGPSRPTWSCTRPRWSRSTPQSPSTWPAWWAAG